MAGAVEHTVAIWSTTLHLEGLHARRHLPAPHACGFLGCDRARVLAQSLAMEVSYQLTQRDFLDSFIAHRNRSPVTKWGLRLLFAFFFTLGGGVLLLVVLRPDRMKLSDVFPIFVLVAVWSFFIWGLPRWAARNQYRKQPSARGPITATFDAGGVHWRWDGGSSEIQWKNFIRCLEAREQILLYPSPAYFSIVPKRAFTSEQMAEFRTLVGQHIPPAR